MKNKLSENKAAIAVIAITVVICIALAVYSICNKSDFKYTPVHSQQVMQISKQTQNSSSQSSSYNSSSSSTKAPASKANNSKVNNSKAPASKVVNP